MLVITMETQRHASSKVSESSVAYSHKKVGINSHSHIPIWREPDRKEDMLCHPIFRKCVK